MEISGYVGLAAAVIAAGVILWFISAINRFARMAVKITESDSGVDVALTKRYDTLTKMLDVTKAYAKHEAETFAEIVKLRAGMSVGEKAEANRLMDEMAGRINVLAESYPELKSSENFRQLQAAISEAEEHLQAARRIYNMNVSRFNQLLASWPASVVGNMRRLEPKEFFKAEELKKSDVKMAF